MKPTSDFIAFHRPSIGPREEEAVLRVLRSGWITSGPEAMEFERDFAAYVGSPRALAAVSGTAALHLALEAFGIKAGDRVATSAYTFTATAEVARYLGAEVSFCDVLPGGHNLDPSSLEKVLDADPGIKAIVPVHIAGEICDMESVLVLARKRGIPVIEDAAHAFPSPGPLGYAGTMGDAGFYSFYATKTLATGEGGMVVCRDPEKAERMALMRLHGIDKLAWDRYSSKKAAWKYEVVEAGFKYNMTDLCAALGRVQLSRAEELLAERTRIAGIYRAAFAPYDFLECPADSPGHAWHLFILKLARGKLSLDRDGLIQGLAEKGIGTSVHFIPLHLMPYWSKRYKLRPGDFPRALDSFERSLSLPLWPGMTEEMIARVASAVIELCLAAFPGRAT